MNVFNVLVTGFLEMLCVHNERHICVHRDVNVKMTMLCHLDNNKNFKLF